MVVQGCPLRNVPGSVKRVKVRETGVITKRDDTGVRKVFGQQVPGPKYSFRLMNGLLGRNPGPCAFFVATKSVNENDAGLVSTDCLTDRLLQDCYSTVASPGSKSTSGISCSVESIVDLLNMFSR